MAGYYPVDGIPREVRAYKDVKIASQQCKKQIDKSNVRYFYARARAQRNTRKRNRKRNLSREQVVKLHLMYFRGMVNDTRIESSILAQSFMCATMVWPMVLNEVEEISQLINVANNTVSSVVVTRQAKFKVVVDGNVYT